MGHKGLCVAFVARVPVGPAQGQKMLVAVQLPDDLVIADLGRIEVVDPAPVHQRRPFSRDRLEMPVDRLPEMKVV